MPRAPATPHAPRAKPARRLGESPVPTGASPTSMRPSERARVTLALAGAFALLALAVGLTLSGSPMSVVGTNSTLAGGVLAETAGSSSVCQSGEALPAGVSAIRLTMESDIGPSVTVRVSSGKRLLTAGTAPSGWTGGSIAVPVTPLARAAYPVRVCAKLGPTRESVALVGSRTAPGNAATTLAGQTLPGRIKVEYLRRAPRSWWSIASSVARRIGLGREPSGGWIVLPMLALVGMALVAGCWLVVKELR